MAVLTSATATAFAHSALAGSPGPARWLGSFPTACYLQLGSGEVIAVLTADAVQLPIGLTLPWPSSQLDLRLLAPDGCPVTVGTGRSTQLRLGRLRIEVTGQRDAALYYCGQPRQRFEPEAETLLEAGTLPEFGPDELSQLFTEPAAVVGRLLGRGPGLTPAGDDLLCGALAATVLFGLPRTALAEVVLGRLAASPSATTSLSRQLLLSAVDGDGLTELQELGQALCQPAATAAERAWRRLLRIGHSSGAALGIGLLAGARQAAATRTAAA